MTNFTPRPWFVSEEVAGHNEEAYQDSANNPGLYIEAESYGTVAEIGGGELAVRRNNARLIAAAPDLLAACEAVLTLIATMQGMRSDPEYIEKVSKILEDAIAKAKLSE